MPTCTSGVTHGGLRIEIGMVAVLTLAGDDLNKLPMNWNGRKPQSLSRFPPNKILRTRPSSNDQNSIHDTQETICELVSAQTPHQQTYLSSANIFADDLKIYMKISHDTPANHAHDSQACQNDITTLQHTAASWRLQPNQKKCVVMHFKEKCIPYPLPATILTSPSSKLWSATLNLVS